MPAQKASNSWVPNHANLWESFETMGSAGWSRLINIEPIWTNPASNHRIILIPSSFNLSSSTILAGSFLASCSLNVLKFLPWSESMSEYYRNIIEYHLWAIPDNSIPKLFSFAWKTMKKKQLLKTQRSVFTERERERERGLLAGPWVFGDFLAKGILAGYDASMKLAGISQGSIRSSIRVDLIALEEKSKVMEDTEGPWRPMCLE